MRKMWYAKGQLVWILTAAMTAGILFPARAEEEKKTSGFQKEQAEMIKSEEKSLFPLKSEALLAEGKASSDAEKQNPDGEASPSDAEETTQDKDASPSDAKEEQEETLLLNSATGDLWEEWIGGNTDWDGDGTKSNPFKIRRLSDLMGLSEAVAQGESFFDVYFELQNDIYLGDLEKNGGSWNPIGWFRSRSELGGEPATPFMGNFDGCGHTVSGLKFAGTGEEYSYLGLFGLIEDASIQNLNVEAEEISGGDNVGVLTGCAQGESVLYNITAEGSLYAEGDAGGIAGEVTGGTKKAVLENCTADNIVINSEGINSFAGGIAGNVQKAVIADASASTLDTDSSRIQGKGYAGGIAGRQNETDIYNACVAGTVGGNGTKAAGGITGLYESGNMIGARFEGEIGRTGNGVASHEGTFIGTREPENGFRYGTGRQDNIAFLFAGTPAQAKNAIGSSIPDDNAWTMDAHIGYFTDYQRRYCLVAGTKEEEGKDRFFYEEMEDAIQHIITQKLGQNLDEFWKDRPFSLDHFAPGNSGEPVRGYLVSIPRIDTKNANGTYDSDVAVMTAISSTNNSYYRQIDKDHPSAVAPGCTVTVATAARNTGSDRYQMVYDENEPGKVKPPTYTDEKGKKQPMTYINGGSYSFEMPEADTELNAEYIKVTTSLAMEPDETEISVRQIRRGDRKNPDITTEVRNNEGVLIARYINGSDISQVQVLPVTVHAEHNGQGSSADRTVLWSIDNTDLLTFADGWEGGYTEDDARILPNLNSDFIRTILARETEAQADGNYSEPIKNTIYTDSAVVTASTNPATSSDNQAVTGTCKVEISFQILDQTTLRVEEIKLNRTNLVFDITRKLTGDRKDPKETYTVTGPYVLDASLVPNQPFYKNVAWKAGEGEKLLSLVPSGPNSQSCQATAVFDKEGKNHPAWLQNIVNEDNAKKAADGGYGKLSGKGSITETITATSEDQTNGIVSAQCQAVIRFHTEDQSVIRPEGIRLSETALSYDLSYEFAGDTRSEVVNKTGFGIRDTLSAAVLPELSDTDAHKPYNRKVNWTSSDPDAVSAEEGIITVKEDARWIKEALKEPPYEADKTVTVTAETEDKTQRASCSLTLHFQAKATEADREEEEFEIVLTKTGRRSNPKLTWKGTEGKQLQAVIYPLREQKKPVWSSSDPSVLTVTKNGLAAPETADENGQPKAEWIRKALQSYPYSAEKQVILTASSPDGRAQDEVLVKLTFRLEDLTYSSSGGGGSSGGGSSSGGGGSSGSSSSSGSGPAGAGNSSYTASGPAGESQNGISGTWTYTEEGFWSFTSEGQPLLNQWAYILNPYAAEGQEAVSWFRFDEKGRMVTGWFSDTDGNLYYLWPYSDGTMGRMVTGWNWTDRDGDGQEECCYFHAVSDGTKGRLVYDTTTSDGYEVNEDGVWTVDGAVQKREK